MAYGPRTVIQHLPKLIFIILSVFSCEDQIPELALVSIEGIVIEASSGDGIAGVEVAILDQEDLTPRLTGVDGSFQFIGLRLDDGTYELQVSSPDHLDETTVFTIENGQQIDSISIELIASEALTFDQAVLDFGSGTEEITLSINNVSSSTQQVNVSTEASWLNIPDSQIVLGEGATEEITIAVQRSEVEVGDFEATVLFEVEGRPDQQLIAKMQKLNPSSGILTLNRSSIDLGKADQSQAVTLSNIGQSALTWSAEVADNWISISSTSGTIPVGSTFELTVEVSRDELQNGRYESAVSFSGNGGTATLSIAMEVDSSVGLLKLSTSSLDFQQDTETSQVTLTNGGTNSLDWTSSVNAEWISMDVESGTLDPGATNTLSVTVDRSILDAGSYEGTVDFIYNEEVTTLSIAVEVLGGVFSSSATSVSLGSDQENQTITFSNTGQRSLSWTAEETSAWLNVAPKEGEIAVGESSSVLIEVDRTGLGLGDYSSNITVSSEGTSTTISVSMTVSQDTDADGVPDEVDADVDGDGLIEIYSINDLDEVRNDLNADGGGLQGAPSGGFTGFELMRNLDFSNDDSYDDLRLKPAVASGSGWEPIGYNTSGGFNAIFEGNDFTISNLFINRTTNYTALFESTGFSASIQNLNITIRYLSGGGYTAGLVGFNEADLTSCSVDGSISATGSIIGLLVGEHEQGAILSCHAMGEVSSNSSRAGGLVGYIGSGSSDSWEITSCYADVAVNGTEDVGGFIGEISSFGSGSISSCYALGNVTASGYNAGGFIGIAYQSVTNCYARGNVTSSSSGSFADVGGLIGDNRATITACYSTGTPSGASNVGGLVGNGTSITSDNYWDTETSDTATSDGGTGQTTSQLQSPTTAAGIYITWSSSVWDFGTSAQYPALKDMPGGISNQRQ